VDYFFVSSTEFDQLVANGAFLEWAHVHGHRYGTHRKLTEDLLSAGQDVLFDIDIQGGRQIADALEDTALLFVLPPNRDVLEARLRGRLSDSEEQIVRRLEAAHDEIKEAGFYDYWIINEDLDKALEEMKSVLWAERLKRSNKELMKQVFFMQGND
jgi:guanylate kinase